MSTTDFVSLWLHVLALATYAGATLALLLMVLPAARAVPDPRARRTFLTRALRTYDPLAIAALGVLVMTGAFNLTTYKEALRGEFFARMGWLLVWKLSLAFLLIMVGTYLTLGLGHRVVRAEMAGDPVDERWLAGMTRRLVYGCILALVLTAVTTWLGLAIAHPGESMESGKSTARQFEGSSSTTRRRCMEHFIDARAAAAYAPEKLKKVNLFESERMFCDVYGLHPGQEQSAHAHAGSDKVYFVLEGVGRFRVGEEERTVGGGYAVVAPAGLSHAVSNPGPGRLALLVFMAPKPSASPG